MAGGGVDTRVDPVALHHYLSFHSIVPAPRTILRGVRKLPPATVLISSRTGAGASAATGTRRSSATRRARTGRRRTGRARSWTRCGWRCGGAWCADVPVGILLSGGLDSSLIVALLAEQGQHGPRDVLRRLRDVGDREGDEFEFSDLVAAEFGTDHHQIRVGPERLLPALPRAIAAMSEPMVSHDAVAFFLLSEEVSKQRKVVQSGQGADEVFGGYYWYPPLLEADGDGLDVYTGAFFDRDDAGVRVAAGGGAGRPRATRRARWRRRGSRRRARPARSTAGCGSTPR